MNRPDRFWRSIDVLATAYLEGTLEPYKCEACAVGNLIAAETPGASVHKSIQNWPSHSTAQDGLWKNASCYGPWPAIKAVQMIDGEVDELVGDFFFGVDLLPLTNYSIMQPLPEAATTLPYDTIEFWRIEKALMLSVRAIPEHEDMFDALMSVVETLFDIHEVEDEDLRAEAKQSFEGDYNTVEAVLA